MTDALAFCLFYWPRFRFPLRVIARVTLELALGKEFDYLIPDALEDEVEVGTRVKVPFAHRQVLGCVTALLESSPHANLRPILKTIGRQSFVTPKILELARWMGDYYCCPPETALKSVLPEAVRKEKEGWREQLFVRALPAPEPEPKLSKRQREILEMARAGKELPLQNLLRQANTTAQTLRRLEDKGLLQIAPQISERDPYAREIILPTQPLSLNPEQAARRRANHPGHFRPGRRRRRLQAGFPLARRDGQRQDGSLFAGHRPRPATGPGRHCPGAGNFVDSANRRAFQGPLQRRPAARRWWPSCTAICPPANAMTNGTKSARAAPASSSARARPFSRRWTRWA